MSPIVDYNPSPENTVVLKIEKCNKEIWSEITQPCTRSNDLKPKKTQCSVLKAMEAT